LVSSEPTSVVGPTVGVVAVQGAVAAHRRCLEGLGVTVVAVRRREDLDGVDAVVLPGGESTTMWQLLGSSDLRDALASALRGGLPALGTCAGMILLGGDILDGRSDQGSFGVLDVAVRRNAFGRQVASFETGLDVRGIDGGPFHAVFIRAPVVERVGEGVEVIAAVDGRAVAVREGSVLGTAFHPELAGDDRVHRYFLQHCVRPARGIR
jgi:pyridoxal 5'-phosphate synthase pdxT subunit